MYNIKRNKEKNIGQRPNMSPSKLHATIQNPPCVECPRNAPLQTLMPLARFRKKGHEKEASHNHLLISMMSKSCSKVDGANAHFEVDR